MLNQIGMKIIIEIMEMIKTRERLIWVFFIKKKIVFGQKNAKTKIKNTKNKLYDNF